MGPAGVDSGGCGWVFRGPPGEVGGGLLLLRAGGLAAAGGCPLPDAGAAGAAVHDEHLLRQPSGA